MDEIITIEDQAKEYAEVIILRNSVGYSSLIAAFTAGAAAREKEIQLLRDLVERLEIENRLTENKKSEI